MDYSKSMSLSIERWLSNDRAYCDSWSSRGPFFFSLCLLSLSQGVWTHVMYRFDHLRCWTTIDQIMYPSLAHCDAAMILVDSEVSNGMSFIMYQDVFDRWSLYLLRDDLQ